MMTKKEQREKIVTVAGKGNPPQEDPQVFLGALSLSPSFLSPPQHSLFPVSFPRYNRSTPFSLHFLDINVPPYRPDLLFHSNSAQLSLNYNLYISIMLDGIRHPQFLRLTKTEYVVNNPEAWRHDIVHVGQISTYLTFDKLLRGNRTITNSTDIPIGYMDFAIIFNTGKHPHDKQRRVLCDEIHEPCHFMRLLHHRRAMWISTPSRCHRRCSSLRISRVRDKYGYEDQAPARSFPGA